MRQVYPRVNIKNKAPRTLDFSLLCHDVTLHILGTLEENESDDIVIAYYREKDGASMGASDFSPFPDRVTT